MNIWWLAIDRNHKFCSYEELKNRAVVAQGWPLFGDLSTQIEFRYQLKRSVINEAIQKIGDQMYKGYEQWKTNREHRRAPRIFWNLINLRAGDLIVGIEGTNVRGICELPVHGIDGYSFDPKYEYAHGFGGSVEWIDWSQSILGIPPSPPRLSVHGIAKLTGQSNMVKEAWMKYRSSI